VPSNRPGRASASHATPSPLAAPIRIGPSSNARKSVCPCVGRDRRRRFQSASLASRARCKPSRSTVAPLSRRSISARLALRWRISATKDGTSPPSAIALARLASSRCNRSLSRVSVARLWVVAVKRWRATVSASSKTANAAIGVVQPYSRTPVRWRRSCRDDDERPGQTFVRVARDPRGALAIWLHPMPHCAPPVVRMSRDPWLVSPAESRRRRLVCYKNHTQQRPCWFRSVALETLQNSRPAPTVEPWRRAFRLGLVLILSARQSDPSARPFLPFDS
jgi:hypothetical protein